MSSSIFCVHFSVVYSGTAVMVMMGHIGPLGDDGCRHGQSGRMIVLVPLADALHCDHNEQSEYHDKHQRHKNAHDVKAGTKIRKTESKTHFTSPSYPLLEQREPLFPKLLHKLDAPAVFPLAG